MIAILLFALFASSAVAALSAIYRSWRQHGEALLEVREQLRMCDEWREVLITTHETTVRPSGAVILRPNFAARAAQPNRGPFSAAA